LSSSSLPLSLYSIQNPLHGIPREKLLKQVEEFAHKYGLDDKVALFQKGALIAQTPADFESVPGITEAEKEAIRREVTREFPLSYLLVLVY